ncbi:HTH-type transcriptional regulator McbR (plasmid) [Paracoccaceae bacterium]|nr:HTH-type transcriptional regulator McbR [Paracoccaceae bacterium]
MQTIPRETPLPPTLSPPPSLSQKVYEGLVQDIIDSRRRAGDRMVEAAIARDLDVSRTPVREALGRLESDGLIQATTPAGYVIIRPSIEDIREIFEIRRALEPMAFAAVVAKARPEEDAQIRVLRDGVAAAQTPADSAEANRHFRNFWLTRTPNRRLRETLMRFHLQVQLVRAATLQGPSGRRAAAEGAHRLAQAFLSRDPATALTEMTDFVDTALTFYEQAAAEGGLQLPPVHANGGQ